MPGIKGVGLQGLIPIPQRGGALGISPFLFNLSQSTFLAAMSKRNSAGPFAAGVLAQGMLDTSAGADTLAFLRGNQVAGSYFYGNLDAQQGSIVFWITPEWNGNDGLIHYIFSPYANVYIAKIAANVLEFSVSAGAGTISVSTAAWTAGTTYCVVCSWDCVNPIDGTNYMRISVNDVHTFGKTSAIILTVPPALWYIGSRLAVPQNRAMDAIVEGFTVYRRVLWDGAYGVNVGNGDEINLIYAAGAGADPCTITGS